jgi:hypothetical protein
LKIPNSLFLAILMKTETALILDSFVVGFWGIKRVSQVFQWFKTVDLFWIYATGLASDRLF